MVFRKVPALPSRYKTKLAWEISPKPEKFIKVLTQTLLFIICQVHRFHAIDQP